MYRIYFLVVTVLLSFCGCGGPGAGDLYDVEKRLTQSEQFQSRATETLDQVELVGRETEAKLQQFEQKVAQLSDRVPVVEEPAKNSAQSAIDDRNAELQDRVKSLEEQVAALESKTRIREQAMALSQGAAATAFGSPTQPVDAKPESAAPDDKKQMRGGKNFETTIFSWNVESEGSDPQRIAQQLTEMNRYDIYGLCEVLPESIELYADALGPDYATIATRSGFNDRLQIIYNTKVYRLLRRMELREINFENRYRSPLVAHLEHRQTGQQLLVMNNHLARGRAEVRERQAEQLVEWAREQTIPIVAVGDYNYDYVFRTRKGNDGFVAMMRDGIWKWVEPVDLIDTNWFDNPSRPDGKDDYPGSMLDFAFVAGAATEWKSECRVIVREGDFPDNESTSDHRPFELKLISR